MQQGLKERFRLPNILTCKLDTKYVTMETFKFLSVPNTKYSTSESELKKGILMARVYMYNPIVGTPEVRKGAVYIDGFLVGVIRPHNRLTAELLIRKGAECSVEVRGGPYVKVNPDAQGFKYTIKHGTERIRAILTIKQV